jgi:CubicO group peptidase (beta-lactamase class C family)
MNRIALSFCFASLVVAAQDFGAIDAATTPELSKLKLPGASIAVVKGDRIVYSKAFGTANVETGEPMRPEMLFRLGSTTKMFTAAALVGLAMEGKLDLNAPIGARLSFLPPKLAAITANQLLSHTAGLYDEAPMNGSHDDSALGNGIRGWTAERLFTPPGKVFSYSNPGYWVAGYLVETLSAKPYADAMESRLFKPLGMERTTLRPTMAMTWPLAQGHELKDGKAAIARPAADNSAGWPAGSMFSNTRDLARFVIAFVNEGRLDGKLVIDPKIIALMSKEHAVVPAGGSYGYGLVLTEFRGVHQVAHDGSRSGYRSAIRMIPAQHVAVIIQVNGAGAPLPDTSEKALEIVASLGPREQSEKKPVAIKAADLARVAGTYQNGSKRFEILARDGKLYLKEGGGEVELKKYGESSFQAGSRIFMTIGGKDGVVAYIHAGSRSYARVV